jgi:hypothetical protein
LDRASCPRPISPEDQPTEKSLLWFTERQFDCVRFPKPIRIESVGQIVSDRRSDDPSVCGLIIKNPFKNKKLIPKGRLEHSPFGSLYSTEFLICDLSDWHDVNDLIDYYYLTRIEGTQIGETHIFRPVGTWNAILKKAPPRRSETFQQIHERLKII